MVTRHQIASSSPFKWRIYLNTFPTAKRVCNPDKYYVPINEVVADLRLHGTGYSLPPNWIYTFIRPRLKHIGQNERVNTCVRIKNSTTPIFYKQNQKQSNCRYLTHTHRASVTRLWWNTVGTIPISLGTVYVACCEVNTTCLQNTSQSETGPVFQAECQTLHPMLDQCTFFFFPTEYEKCCAETYEKRGMHYTATQQG